MAFETGGLMYANFRCEIGGLVEELVYILESCC
jgi:hypothetical protein